MKQDIYERIFDTKGIIERYEGNPIITACDIPYEVNSVFNPGAALYNGKVYLLARVENKTGHSHFNLCISDDGFTGWKIGDKPWMKPEPEKYPEEEFGIEDARITYIDGKYIIAYCAYSRKGPRIALAETEDFENIRRYGVVIDGDNKDAALFPKKINGRYMMLHRPFIFSEDTTAHIHLASSEDLVNWKDHGILVKAGTGGTWENRKVGAGPQPIELEDGWLVIYHGVRHGAAGNLYRAGAMILDKKDPSQILYRCKEWVLSPMTYYEKQGDIPDVVFPCGIVEKDNKLLIYYGGADTVIGVASVDKDSFVKHIKERSQ